MDASRLQLLTCVDYPPLVHSLKVFLTTEGARALRASLRQSLPGAAAKKLSSAFARGLGYRSAERMSADLHDADAGTVRDLDSEVFLAALDVGLEMDWGTIEAVVLDSNRRLRTAVEEEFARSGRLLRGTWATPTADNDSGALLFCSSSERDARTASALPLVEVSELFLTAPTSEAEDDWPVFSTGEGFRYRLGQTAATCSVGDLEWLFGPSAKAFATSQKVELLHTERPTPDG